MCGEHEFISTAQGTLHPSSGMVVTMFHLWGQKRQNLLQAPHLCRSRLFSTGRAVGPLTRNNLQCLHCKLFLSSPSFWVSQETMARSLASSLACPGGGTQKGGTSKQFTMQALQIVSGKRANGPTCAG